MRIVFAVNNYPPRVGGVEFHVRNLAAELVSLGHDVTVCALAPEASEGEEGGIRVVRLREHLRIGDVLAFPSPRSAARVWRAVRGADVVSVHTRFFPMTWLGVAAARAAGVPVVLTEHGSDHVSAESTLVRWGARVVDVTLGRRALRRATAVIGVSDAVVAFVQRLAGVEASVFHNAINAPPDGLWRPGDRPSHLVFVGRLVAGKGWATFLDAVAELSATRPGVSAEILGGGPDLDAVRARVHTLGLDDVVDVRGRVDPAEVLRSLAGATLLNPTVLSEGFQTTLLEALAVGGRVVSYPVPGAAALATRGAPVVVVDPGGDALVRGVAQVAALAPWEPTAIEGWTWPAQARAYASLLEGVVGSSKG